MNRRALLSLVLSEAAMTSGCAGLLAAIQQAATGAVLVGDALSIAEQVAKDWFASHPDPEAQKKVEAAIQAAHDALAELHDAIEAAKAAGKADVVAPAAMKVLETYKTVKAAVDELQTVQVGEERKSKLPLVSDVAKALGVSPS